MKISYVKNEFHQVGFLGTAEDQDGFPKQSWIFTDLAPRWFSGGRKALACALPYLNYVSGKLTVDSQLTPLTASLLRDLLPPGEVYIDSASVNFKPTDIQKGGATLHVKAVNNVTDAQVFVDNALDSEIGIRQTALAVLKNDGMRGFLTNPQFRVVASNYWLVEALCSKSDALFALCSIALLYSEDLSARKIIIYEAPNVDQKVLVGLTQAFYSVGIILEFA